MRIHERFGRLRRGRHVADAFGWSLHAGSSVLDSDRDALERLLRYFTRPPLAQHRLALLRDGRVAYALRKPWRRGQTHRIMSPLQLIVRLTALIPAPRHPLLRFHGAFAPHSSWRKAVVPLTPPRPRAPRWQCPQPAAAADASGASPDSTHQNGGADSVPARGGSSATSVTSDTRARLSRIDWATLLWRVYDVDALACSCGTRLRFVALFTDRAWAGTALDALGLGDRDSDDADADSDPTAPQIRARDPPLVLLDEPFRALDPITREALQDELRSLARRLIKTFVLVTHDVFEAVRLGSRIAVMNAGCVEPVATSRDLVRRPASELVEKMLGRHRYPLKLMTLSVVDVVSSNVQTPSAPIVDLLPDASVWDALDRLESSGAELVRVGEGPQARYATRRELLEASA